MDKLSLHRINYVSHLFITSSVYKVLVDIDIKPTDAKKIIDAIESGIKSANAYDETLQMELGNV